MPDNHTPEPLGEPWTMEVSQSHPHRHIYDKDDKYIASIVDHDLNSDAYGERILACVNALSGLNPVAVKGLIDAADTMVNVLKWPLISKAHSTAIVALYDALAALRAKP